MEETLSTLDYAIRAKSIRNKPELNQRTTRNSLIKDYVAEIERLKADLVAAREKNGIFFSEETWTQMTVEQELRVTELEEAKKQVGIVEGQMRGVREEFEQSIGLLKIREGELKDTRNKLQTAEVALEQKEEELVVVKGALEEETVVRKAHQDTEVTLDQVANGLKIIAKNSVVDLQGVFEKLGGSIYVHIFIPLELFIVERKTNVLNSNSQVVLVEGTNISGAAEALSQKLAEFARSSLQSISKLRGEAKEFQVKETETLGSSSSKIDQQLQVLRDALDVIQAKDVAEAEALEIVHDVIHQTQETFKTGFSAWGQTLTKSCEETCGTLELVGADAFKSVEAALKSMVSLVDAVVQETSDFIEAEREDVLRVKALVDDASQKEISRLRHQNEALVKMLEVEKVKGNKAKDELIQRVSGLLGDFTAERDRSLREAVGVVQHENRAGEDDTKALMEQHSEIMEQMEAAGTEVDQALQTRRNESKRTRDGALKVSPRFISQ